MVYLIFFLLLIILILFLHIFKLRLRVDKTLKGVEDILNMGIDGSILNEHFDESKLSKLEEKTMRFVRDNLQIKADLDHEKDQIKALIGDISHQTKTPIANISLYMELLSEKYEDEYIKIVTYETDKLKMLIDILIKSSRLESGMIQMNLEEVEFDEYLDRIVSSSGFKENVKIELEDESFLVKLDERWTEEAIINLIDNGIKYSYEGELIKIRLSKTYRNLKVEFISKGDMLLLEEYNEIFKRFYRGKNSKNVDGVGIGLFLTRTILEMEDGYILVESKDGFNIFSIFLPLV